MSPPQFPLTPELQAEIAQLTREQLHGAVTVEPRWPDLVIVVHDVPPDWRERIDKECRKAVVGEGP